MIEVEKKFIPTEENLKILLNEAVFLGEIVNHDICYDYPDWRMLKAGDIVLRARNGKFELKIKKSQGANIEIENNEEIANYFKTTNLEGFVSKNLIIAIEYRTTRKKYKKENFNIDIDETDFGYKVGEIEVMIEKEEEIKNAEDKIQEFALKNNLELSKGLSKKNAYLKKFNIEL